MIIVPTNTGRLAPPVFKSAGYFTLAAGPSSLAVSIDDIIVLFACCDQNVSATAPAGWTKLTDGGGATGYSLCWRKATSTSIDIGYWGNAGGANLNSYAVLSGSGIGSYAATKNAGEANDGSTSIYSPGITPLSTDSQIMVWGFVANFSSGQVFASGGYDGSLTLQNDPGLTGCSTRSFTQPTGDGSSKLVGTKGLTSPYIRWRTASVEIIP